MPSPMFVRVRDTGTRHEFDVTETDPRIGEVFELLDSERYPPAFTMRPPKYHTDLADLPVARSEAPRPAASRKATKKES